MSGFDSIEIAQRARDIIKRQTTKTVRQQVAGALIGRMITVDQVGLTGMVWFPGDEQPIGVKLFSHIIPASWAEKDRPSGATQEESSLAGYGSLVSVQRLNGILYVTDVLTGGVFSTQLISGTLDGARVEITPEGFIELYDSSNLLIGEFNPSNVRVNGDSGSYVAMNPDIGASAQLQVNPNDPSAGHTITAPGSIVGAIGADTPLIKVVAPRIDGLGSADLQLTGRSAANPSSRFTATADLVQLQGDTDVSLGDFRVRNKLVAGLSIDQRTTDAGAISSSTLVTVLSVILPVVGTYHFDMTVLLTSTVAAGVPAFALGGSSVPTDWRWISQCGHYNTAAGSQGFSASGTAYPGTTSGQVLSNTNWTTTTGFSWARITGTVTVSAIGTLNFRFSNNGGGNSINVKAGSIVKVHQYA